MSQPPTNQEPVAYDIEGNPLYASPISASPALDGTQVETDHGEFEVKKNINHDDEIKRRHEESLAEYPWLNLSEGEYVISAVRRHVVGLVGQVVVITILLSIVAIFAMNYSYMAEYLQFNKPYTGYVVGASVLLGILFCLGGYLSLWAYVNNRFFLTNECVIHEIQTSIFTKFEQTVSLDNVEDVSYSQSGFMQSIFDYGSIRLSTEGEETTYRFNYVSSPKAQIRLINDAIEEYKKSQRRTG